MAVKAPWSYRPTAEVGQAQAPVAPWPTEIVEKTPATILPLKKARISTKDKAKPQRLQATPRELQIGTLLDDRLRLKMPISTQIEQEGDFYIAKCEYIGEYGYGESPMEAVDDLRLAMAELYWTLKEEYERLAPNLVQIWNRLCELIDER